MGNEHIRAAIQKGAEVLTRLRRRGGDYSQTLWDDILDAEETLQAAHARYAGSWAEAVEIEFGKGDKVVDTGTIGNRPGVFVKQAKEPGTPGESAKSEQGALDEHSEGWILTFPSIKQARLVADAICGISPAQAVPDVPRSLDLYTNNGDVRHDYQYRLGWNACREAMLTKEKKDIQ